MEDEKIRKDRDVNLMEDYMSLQERVYILLRERILTGELPPNAVLNTSRLSQQLNVSRTPVRDAINRLISVGLAVKVVHREARVADFMSDEVYEIFKARSALEGIAAGSAARYMKEDDKQQLILFAQMAESCTLNVDKAGFMEADQKMHFLLYESMKTPILQDMAKQLYMLVRHNSAMGLQIEGRGEQVRMEHRTLVDVILKGDANLAEKAGYQHQYNSISNMRQKFERLKNEKNNDGKRGEGL